jgi:triosephosphate isomerase
MVEMKTRRFFVGGNWKMNGNLALIRTIVESTLKELPQGLEVDIILAPPTPYLATLKTACDGIGMVQIAAQNVHEKSAGAFTGEISVTMLEDLHIPWTIIGHSERRTLFGESNELIGEKLDTVFSSNGLKAVVCVGESLQERESGITAQVLCAQLAALPMEGWNDRVVIAYEPVWAIGTGKVATVQQV